MRKSNFSLPPSGVPARFSGAGEELTAARAANQLLAREREASYELIELLMEENRRLKEREALLEQQLKLKGEEASRDPMTGLLNRRGFTAMFETAQKNLADNPNKDQAFLIFSADANRLKFVNDTYGHPAGDAYLKAMADALQDAMRDTDAAARFGGDEYVAMMTGFTTTHDPDADAALAADATKKLRDRICAKTALCVDKEGITRHIPLSISAGAVLCLEGDDLEAKLAEADEIMYANKKAFKAAEAAAGKALSADTSVSIPSVPVSAPGERRRSRRLQAA